MFAAAEIAVLKQLVCNHSPNTWPSSEKLRCYRTPVLIFVRTQTSLFSSQPWKSLQQEFLSNYIGVDLKKITAGVCFFFKIIQLIKNKLWGFLSVSKVTVRASVLPFLSVQPVEEGQGVVSNWLAALSVTGSKGRWENTFFPLVSTNQSLLFVWHSSWSHPFQLQLPGKSFFPSPPGSRVRVSVLSQHNYVSQSTLKGSNNLVSSIVLGEVQKTSSSRTTTS